MRPISTRARLLAVALSVSAFAVPAQAVEFLCGDICQCWVGCSRRCTDDTSGFSTTCGAAGYACNGQCALALDQRLAFDTQATLALASLVSQTPGVCASTPAALERAPARAR